MNRKDDQEKDDLSKKEIKKVILNVSDNLKCIYAEKERLFTDFILINFHKTLILTDRSGRILFMDPNELSAQKQTMKGYRNC